MVALRGHHIYLREYLRKYSRFVPPSHRYLRKFSREYLRFVPPNGKYLRQYSRKFTYLMSVNAVDAVDAVRELNDPKLSPMLLPHPTLRGN